MSAHEPRTLEDSSPTSDGPLATGDWRLATTIVPVKHLSVAKSRLGGRFGADERSALVVAMLRTVLGALADSGVVATRLVVSPDPSVLAVAAAAGAATLRQAGAGLNPALEAARAATRPTGPLLVLPADLPLLRPDEVIELLAMTYQAPVVVAPDRAGYGTNALALAPGVTLPFLFGPGSRARHLAAAAALGLTALVYHAPGLALDLDTPADLAELGRLGWSATVDGTPVMLAGSER